MKPVTCNNCGQQWPRDPALEVDCPKCGAKIGVKCRFERPSEHKLNPAFLGKPDVCPERDELALKIVPGYGKCPGKKGKKMLEVILLAIYFILGAFCGHIIYYLRDVKNRKEEDQENE